MVCFQGYWAILHLLLPSCRVPVTRCCVASYSANKEMTGLSSCSASNLTNPAFETRTERLCATIMAYCPLALKIFCFLNFHFPPSSVNSVVQNPFLTCLIQKVPQLEALIWDGSGKCHYILPNSSVFWLHFVFRLGSLAFVSSIP